MSDASTHTGNTSIDPTHVRIAKTYQSAPAWLTRKFKRGSKKRRLLETGAGVLPDDTWGITVGQLLAWFVDTRGICPLDRSILLHGNCPLTPEQFDAGLKALLEGGAATTYTVAETEFIQLNHVESIIEHPPLERKRLADLPVWPAPNEHYKPRTIAEIEGADVEIEKLLTALVARDNALLERIAELEARFSQQGSTHTETADIFHEFNLEYEAQMLLQDRQWCYNSLPTIWLEAAARWRPALTQYIPDIAQAFIDFNIKNNCSVTGRNGWYKRWKAWVKRENPKKRQGYNAYTTADTNVYTDPQQNVDTIAKTEDPVWLQKTTDDMKATAAARRQHAETQHADVPSTCARTPTNAPQSSSNPSWQRHGGAGAQALPARGLGHASFKLVEPKRQPALTPEEVARGRANVADARSECGPVLAGADAAEGRAGDVSRAEPVGGGCDGGATPGVDAAQNGAERQDVDARAEDYVEADSGSDHQGEPSQSTLHDNTAPAAANSDAGVYGEDFQNTGAALATESPNEERPGSTCAEADSSPLGAPDGGAPATAEIRPSHSNRPGPAARDADRSDQSARLDQNPGKKITLTMTPEDAALLAAVQAKKKKNTDRPSTFNHVGNLGAQITARTATWVERKRAPEKKPPPPTKNFPSDLYYSDGRNWRDVMINQKTDERLKRKLDAARNSSLAQGSHRAAPPGTPGDAGARAATDPGGCQATPGGEARGEKNSPDAAPMSARACDTVQGRPSAPSDNNRQDGLYSPQGGQAGGSNGLNHKGLKNPGSSSGNDELS